MKKGTARVASFFFTVAVLGCGGAAGSAAKEPAVATAGPTHVQQAWRSATPLGVLPVDDPRPLDAQEDFLSYRLHSAVPEQLVTLLRSYGCDATRSPEGARFTHCTAATHPPRAHHLAASFLVNYDARALAPILQELPPPAAAQSSPQNWVAAVQAALPHPQYGDFLTAGQAARRRAGDCTEHAVLFAAIARSHAVPARLVFGYVIADEPNYGHRFAYGHAWTELFYDQRWHAIDPAQARSAVDAHYIPLGELRKEGMDYKTDLIRLMEHSAVEKISLR